MAERIGVLGGTFDPIHVGHIVAAAETRYALSLDRVLLVVANLPWQKAGRRAITPAEDRYAVVAAAVQDTDGLEASRLEIDRGGLSYTADTLEALTAARPGAELFLIIGSDLVADLSTWERIEQVQSRATLVVVSRPGAAPSRPSEEWRVTSVTIPGLDISSSDLRERLGAGRPIDGLVPAAAVHEIRRRGLYIE